MFQLAEFCRICLSKTNELIALENQDEDDSCLKEKLIFINRQLIPLDDQFPNWVCVSCKTQINDAYRLLEKALESYNVLEKLMKHLKETGESNEREINDLLTIPTISIKEEINENMDENKNENMDENMDDEKDATNVLKIRSISSINAIIHSPQSQEECILGDTNQDPNLIKLLGPFDEACFNLNRTQTCSNLNGAQTCSNLNGTQTCSTKKDPITVLFNPKSGRIVPLKKPSEPGAPLSLELQSGASPLSEGASPSSERVPPLSEGAPPPSEGPPSNAEHPIAKYLSESAENYTCNICLKSFRSQVGYTVHKNWHEKLERSVPGIEYSCEYCTRAPFKTLGGLKRHLNEHSTHFKRLKKLKQKETELRSGKMVFPGVDLRFVPMGPLCGECHKCFLNFGELNRHRRREKHELHKLYTTQKD